MNEETRMELAALAVKYDSIRLELAELRGELAIFEGKNPDDRVALILRSIDLTAHRLACEFELLENVADGQEVAK